MIETYLILDNGGLMTPKMYKQHLSTIKYYNRLIDFLTKQKEGTADYLKLLIKLTRSKEYIKNDLETAEKMRRKAIIKNK